MKQGEQVTGSKQVSSNPPGPVHQLLPPGSWHLSSHPDFFQGWTVLWKCIPNKLFPPQLSFCSWCFITSLETITKTGRISHSPYCLHYVSEAGLISQYLLPIYWEYSTVNHIPKTLEQRRNQEVGKIWPKLRPEVTIYYTLISFNVSPES